MIPELAREAAYKGCNVYIRISGYSTQVNDQWILTNRTWYWRATHNAKLIDEIRKRSKEIFEMINELMDINRNMTYPDQEILDAATQEYKIDNRDKTDRDIPGYLTVGCMRNALLTSRAVYNTLVASL